MQENKALQFIDKVLKNQPKDWLGLTTHRLDVYNEEFAKTEFLEKLELLFKADNVDRSTLTELPTAYDYIRLGHSLSCILEWGVGRYKKFDGLSRMMFLRAIYHSHHDGILYGETAGSY